MNVFKTGLGLVVLAMVLTGCSSTSTPEEPVTPPAEDTSATTTGIDDSGVMAEEEEPVVLGTVFYFDFDKYQLKSEARALLTAHAEQLIASPRQIRLEGHADERGSREYNMALGEKRATAVKEFLVLQGVDPALIETISYGEEKPVALGANEESWALNRRVELK
ncbi:peptidoglycan-associated lipoprotein Pal [Halioxenophilus sp. WMMB6]|uniref:peptidoglycan-associated lipoprotein Pal n=1 Tax=Halioxenophilus sp. WMMB6 TaxID=3073815 RepID=UPI00295E35EE|nr:peptidoglycan-associated lipoprotein Pal [Halioxenophilus sp. WMMB6]